MKPYYIICYLAMAVNLGIGIDLECSSDPFIRGLGITNFCGIIMVWCIMRLCQKHKVF